MLSDKIYKNELLPCTQNSVVLIANKGVLTSVRASEDQFCLLSFPCKQQLMEFESIYRLLPTSAAMIFKCTLELAGIISIAFSKASLHLGGEGAEKNTPSRSPLFLLSFFSSPRQH